MLRRSRIAALALLVAFAASACEMRLELRVTVNDDASGELSFALSLDREMVEAIAAQAQEGVPATASLVEYFECLGDAGWRTSSSEPGGGLDLSAVRGFAGSAEFDRVLDSLQCGDEPAGPASAAGFGGLAAKIDYDVERGLLKTTSRFSGTVDLRGAGLTDEQREQLAGLREVLGRIVKLRIVADLPGVVTVEEGDGFVAGDAAVWTPLPGDLLRMSASSSRFNVGTLLGIVVAALAAAGVLVWFLAGRRRPKLDTMPIEREAPAEPPPPPTDPPSSEPPPAPPADPPAQ